MHAFVFWADVLMLPWMDRDWLVYGLKQQRACWMPHSKVYHSFFWSFPFVVISMGCIAAPECDTIETRKAVFQLVLGDGSNLDEDYEEPAVADSFTRSSVGY